MKKEQLEYGEVEMIQLHEEPQTKRPAEVNAFKTMVKPKLPKARTVDQHYLDMQEEGKELCLRCCLFKYRAEFGKDARNKLRGETQTICLKCDAERKAIKDQIQRLGKRDQNY